MMDQYQQMCPEDQKYCQRISGATQASEFGEKEQEMANRDTNVQVEPTRFYRINLFNQVSPKRPSFKLNKSAVGWIYTNCFIKGLDLQATILAVTLYYSYICKRPIANSKIQLLLSTCIFLSQKFSGPHTMQMAQVLVMASGKYQAEEIVQMENQLLELLEFDLIVENVFEYLHEQEVSETTKSGVSFLMELLLLRDEKILFDEARVDRLIALVEGPNAKQEDLEAVQCLLKSAQLETLRNKYLSEFEVDQLITKLSP